MDHLPHFSGAPSRRVQPSASWHSAAPITPPAASRSRPPYQGVANGLPFGLPRPLSPPAPKGRRRRAHRHQAALSCPLEPQCSQVARVLYSREVLAPVCLISRGAFAGARRATGQPSGMSVQTGRLGKSAKLPPGTPAGSVSFSPPTSCATGRRQRCAGWRRGSGAFAPPSCPAFFQPGCGAESQAPGRATVIDCCRAISR